MQGGCRRQQPLPLFEQIGDVIAAEGVVFEGVFEGAGGGGRAIDFGKGENFFEMMTGVEAFVDEPLVIGFSLGAEGEESGEQFLVVGVAAESEEFPFVIGIDDGLMAIIGTGVAGDEFALMVDGDEIGVDMAGQFPGGGVGGRNGIAIGVIADLKLAVGAQGDDKGAIIGVNG